MFAFVNILKAIATLLITNSHYEVVYPIKILATGGLLGNSIFFLVSGFCLSNIKENFFLWFRKRIIRIYPACTIITILSIVSAGELSGSVVEFVRNFIYPTRYGFIAKIIGLYIPYYFCNKYLMKGKKKTRQVINVVIVTAVYLLIAIINVQYGEWFYYLSLMLTGVLLRDWGYNSNKLKDKYMWVYSLGMLIIYYVMEVLIKSEVLNWHYEIINYLILFSCVFCAFVFFMNKEGDWKVKNSGGARLLVSFQKEHLKYT